jgi:hypothetical protein
MIDSFILLIFSRNFIKFSINFKFINKDSHITNIYISFASNLNIKIPLYQQICPSKQRMERLVYKESKMDQLNHNKNLKKYW